MIQHKNTKSVSKTEILAQNIDYSSDYFEYINSQITDQYLSAWSYLGLTASKAKHATQDLNERFGNGRKSTKLSFFLSYTGYWLVKDFEKDTVFNPYSFAQNFTSESRKYNQFYSTIYNLQSFKDFAAEKRVLNRSNSQNNPNTSQKEKRAFLPTKNDCENAPKHISEVYQKVIGKIENYSIKKQPFISEKEILKGMDNEVKTAKTQTYFENRIYSELGLNENEAKKYFFPSFDNHFGIGINYTDLDQNCIKYGSENKEFDRIRLTTPEGKKKYHSTAGSGYFPYITPLAYNQNLLSQKVLYSIEGEFKAFFACQKLQIPCIGIGGIHLGITINEKVNQYGHTYKDKHSSEFLPLTKEVIEKGKFESYTLIFDSDTFQNIGKNSRAFAFSTAIERQIIAAKKVGIKKFTFTCINPNNVHGAKGLDDLTNHCEPSQIKEKLECNLYHNDLFWHFRVDISKPIKKAFENLKDAFLASAEPKKETTKIITTGFIGNQLTNNINSPFVTSLISQKFTSLVAPTGLGKSYFIEKIFVPFMYQLGFVTIFCSPRNALTNQQASQRKGIVFTEKTNKNAIERLKFEIDTTKIVYSNYDNLETAYTTLTNFHSKTVFIVIDESHLLTSDSTFRPQTIAKVCNTLELNRNNLFLTATPTEIKLSNELNLFEVISTDKKPYERPTLVFTPKNKKLDCTLECIQKAVRTGKRVLVHYNHLDSVKALKKELERQKIEVRICASKGIDKQDLEFFETIQNNNNFLWNNEVKVILTTSVLEIGINLKTDCNTALIYVNNAIYGFDNNSYSQFIARIRNYTDFQIQNTIISANQKAFLPSNDLVLDFDFDLDALNDAKETAELLNKQYQRVKEKNEVKRDRFISKEYQNVLFNTENEVFEVNMQDIFADYTKHIVSKGSPYFCNPSLILFYEKDKIKELEKAKDFVKKEKEAAEKAVFELYENDFYTLLKSVFSQTKDIKLQSLCNLKSNPNESQKLSSYELTAAENLLKNHFYLSKTVKKDVPNDLECKEIKQVITCKESRTIRKTSDLSSRKKAYVIYFLLTNSDSGNRIREQQQINELQRIISIFESCKGKETSLYELLKLANHSRKGKNLYTKKLLLELIEILFEFDSSRKTVNDKKITFYSFEKQKDFLLEMEKLRA